MNEKPKIYAESDYKKPLVAMEYNFIVKALTITKGKISKAYDLLCPEEQEDKRYCSLRQFNILMKRHNLKKEQFMPVKVRKQKSDKYGF